MTPPKQPYGLFHKSARSAMERIQSARSMASQPPAPGNRADSEQEPGEKSLAGGTASPGSLALLHWRLELEVPSRLHDVTRRMETDNYARQSVPTSCVMTDHGPAWVMGVANLVEAFGRARLADLDAA